MLLILIEEHDKVVTREAIADQIWGKGVFGDVDNGINTAVRKIRQVLNDDPQNPIRGDDPWDGVPVYRAPGRG